MKFLRLYRNKRTNECGSALVIILIAVALFGALSFAVSSMVRDESISGIADESLRIYGAEITDYARTVRLGVQNIRISNTCEDTEINFDNNPLTGYTNGGAPSGNVCDVLHINGGGVTYSAPIEEWLDPQETASTLYGEWYFTGNEEISGIGNTGTYDLIMVLPWVHQSVCTHINTQLGISGDTTDGFAFPTNQKFTGSYSSGNTIGAAAAALIGKSTGCVTDSNGGHFFYQVLVAR